MLRFDPEAGSFAVWAYDTHKLPICPLHYARVSVTSTPIGTDGRRVFRSGGLAPRGCGTRQRPSVRAGGFGA